MSLHIGILITLRVHFGGMQQEVRDIYKNTFASLRGSHQREGVIWMCRRESRPGPVPTVAGGILADEMGLGKTYEMVALMRLRPMRTLIVTTLSTLMQWQEVISNHLSALPFVLRGKDQAEGVGFAGVSTVLTTYSMFQHLDKIPRGLFDGWARIILDEAHIIRNPKGNTYRSLCKLQAVHRWVLTGTPVNNNVRDLHTLVAWLGAPGLDVESIRRHLMLRRTKVVEAERSPEFSLPILTIVDSVVHMSEPERQAYAIIEAAGRAHAVGGGASMSTALTDAAFHVRVMEAVLRCRQACTHMALMCDAVATAQLRLENFTVLQQAMRDPRVLCEACRCPVDVLGSAKVTRLVELVSKHKHTEKSLVFCDWLGEMDILETALSEGTGVQVIRFHGAMALGQRQSALQAFENMEMGAVMLVQIQCGGTGLNIQCASRVYMMRPAWNPCTEQQAIARSHRLGQTRPVIVTRLVAADSIDVRCTEIQSRKLAIIDWVMGSSVQNPVQQLSEGSNCGSIRERDRDVCDNIKPLCASSAGVEHA